MSAPALPTLLFRDTFTGTTGTLISARPSDVGGTWAFIPGYTGTTKLFSGAARADVSKTPNYQVATAIVGGNYKVVLKVNTPSVATSDRTDARIYVESTVDGASPYSIGISIATFLAGGPMDVFVSGALYGATGTAFDASVLNPVSLGQPITVELVVVGGTSWFTVNDVLIDTRTGVASAAPSNVSLYLTTPAVLANAITVDSVEVYTGTPAFVCLATGASETLFGTPALLGGQNAEASGFFASSIGIASIPLTASGATPETAFGQPKKINLAAGFSGTTVGTPSIPVMASGFQATAYGSPTVQMGLPATTAGVLTTFGQASWPHLELCDVSPTGPLAKFGGAFAFSFFSPVVSVFASAHGLSTTQFGEATETALVVASAVGATPQSTFGQATSGASYKCAAYSVSTYFGGGLTSFGPSAVGGSTTAIGAPTSRQTLGAATVGTSASYGLPSAKRPGDHAARFVYARAKFGQPKATQIRGFRASGALTTLLGAPSCTQRYRGLHIPPGTRLGKPLMIRNPPC